MRVAAHETQSRAASEFTLENRCAVRETPGAGFGTALAIQPLFQMPQFSFQNPVVVFAHRVARDASGGLRSGMKTRLARIVVEGQAEDAFRSG